MKKFFSFSLIFAVSIILFTSCGNTDTESTVNTSSVSESLEPFRIEFSWDSVRMGNDFDIEFTGDDSGDGFIKKIEDGNAQIIITNADINFDLTFVYLPPLGVLNNLPECTVSIYENGDIKKQVNSFDTSDLYYAPTGAVGFGICSVKEGKLIEYSGEWTAFPNETDFHEMTDISQSIAYPEDTFSKESSEDSFEYKSFLGLHTSNYDGSTILISEASTGNLDINISLFRLCDLENLKGAFMSDMILFEGADPNGDELKGALYFDEEKSLCIEILESTWSYLSNGTVIRGFDE